MIHRIVLFVLMLAIADTATAAAPAHLYRSVGKTKITAVAGESSSQELPAGTLVVVLSKDAAAGEGRVLVRTVELSPQLEGLVAQSELAALPASPTVVAQAAPASATPAVVAPGDLPPLIMQQPKELQAAWKVVDAAIQENATLAKQLPEPYFARGELLAMVQDFDAALRDYLRAVQLASESDRGLISYSAYFARLKEAFEQYDKSPRPPATGLAPLHYASGVHAYRKGDHQKAIVHFSDAISLDEHQPLYWYYRSVSFFQAGMTDRAQHDALVGCHLEWKNGTADRIGTKLAYVQGQARTWLELQRLGNPSDRLVNRRAD
ncbi:MAG: tetratricopeptide repeat protein [Pirellulales bacterium]